MLPVSIIGSVLSSFSGRSKELLSSFRNGLSWGSASKNLPSWYTAVQATRLTPVCHSRVKEVNDEVNSYFLENWPFPNSKSQKGFLGSDFTSCMCYNYPEALDDRIGVACRLIALLFLVDGKSLRAPHP